MRAPANRIDGRAASRRAKYNIVPIVTALCVLVGSANIFLFSKIFLLEKHGGGTANDLATIYTRRGPPRKMPRTSRPTRKYRAANPEPSIGSSWTSPHLVDCRKVAKAKAEEEETGMFVRIGTPAFGGKRLPFEMNIHNPMKDAVSYKIYKEGCFECDHLARLSNALAKYPGSYLLDVGGNIGMWSLVAAAADRQAYAIEPLVENYERMCKSIDRNSFHDRIHLMNVAATSRDATLRIDLPDRNFGGGRVKAVEDVDAIDDEYTVKGVTIDSLNLPTDRPVVVKLDVEGHELQALIGGIDFLRRADVVYAMTELRPTFQRDGETYGSWKKIFGILTSKGLQPYRIDYGDETRLDVKRLPEWRHVKDPSVRYFDVVWRKDD